MKWLLRSFLVSGRKANLSSAGFVLPTIIMVMLVVILLTTAILFRSFDRTKNISNYRVSTKTLVATLPGLDRAKAKISALLDDPTTRGTPTDTALNNALIQQKFDLADETRLQLTYGSNADFNPTSGNGSVRYAWRFPVDTDNNGKFDSLTLYSILFRTPEPNGSEDSRQRTPLEARTKPMQQGTQANSVCAAGAGTSASLTGSQGWYQVGSELKRSFFVYVATVPITNVDASIITPPPANRNGSIPDASKPTNYEAYKGNKSFSALEFQQDKAQLSVSNNAIFYEDDLEISPGPGIMVNGRIMTNSNLFVNAFNPINLNQVSSPVSCYYQAVNGKIIVGGNLTYGSPVNSTNTGPVNVDLFEGSKTIGSDPEENQPLTSSNASVTDSPADMAYNNQAYEARIARLVEIALTLDPSSDPTEVIQGIESELTRLTPSGSQTPVITQEQARQDQLEIYFRKRTRRVPFKEVPFDIPYDPSTDPLYGQLGITTDSQGQLIPAPPEVMYPYNPSDGSTASGYGELTLNTSGGKLEPPATKFSVQEKDPNGKESYLGDRVQVGNNLPQSLPNPNGGPSDPNQEQSINGTTWNNPESASEERTRKTRVTLLSDIADTRRNGFWELNAQKVPKVASDGFGGLRVVTGAGIYLPPRSAPLTSASKVVWPDTMPVIPSPAVIKPSQQPNQPAPSWLPLNPTYGVPDFPVEENGTSYRPYLQMRATAVYHYTHAQGKSPIACVSSYYDPTDENTARNTFFPSAQLPDVSGDPSLGKRTVANESLYRSNNGVTYPPPSITEGSVRPLLNYQTQLVYPNGRPVNQQLKNALEVPATERTLAEQSAVDSALCALQILGTRGVPPLERSTTPTGGYTLPNGTIKEVAFLDARQIKAIDGVDEASTTTAYDTNYEPTGRYDLSIEQRQPLEVRATVLNLDLLRRQRTANAPYRKAEFLLPNSGIIYATRDDALPDATSNSSYLPTDSSRGAPAYSDANDDASDPTGTAKKILSASSNDFLLDPTRRANGIMLTNGLKLWRSQGYRAEEKGLILASNLPVYIKAESPTGIPGIEGGFNIHRTFGGGLVEEFQEKLNYSTPDVGNFYTRDLPFDPNFACRSGDERLPDCTSGDQWRPATIIADAVTLLSSGTNSGFKEGYRSDGDYDLRNNEIDNIPDAEVVITANEPELESGATIELKRLQQGFWNNNFVTSHQFTDSDYSSNTPPGTNINSSYFNNGVTPVQRRGTFSEYLMEMCDKRDVSKCTANDWYIGTYTKNDGSVIPVKASSSIGLLLDPAPQPTMFIAGTTAQFPGADDPTNPDVAKRPRRVAFARKRNNDLWLDGNDRPIPLGINGDDGKVACFGAIASIRVPKIVPQPGASGLRTVRCLNDAAAVPKQADNALWFATTTEPTNPGSLPDNYGYNYPLAYLNGTSPSLPQITPTEPASLQYQPLLVPVLQLQALTLTAGPDVPILNDTTQTRATNWLPRAAGNTTFNLLMAVGDNPSHQAGPVGGEPHDGDFNGGVQNLPHFIENWINPPGTGNNPPSYNTNISGSFIQLKRSYYATAPNTQLPRIATRAQAGGIFNIYKQTYPTGNTNGRAPYYEVPQRNWGFDVGLLSQVPDLFSNQFVLPPTGKPNEFFREVDRSDEWVQTLLCSKGLDRQGDVRSPAINPDQRPLQFCRSNAAD
jgi:hypothetical protein